MASPIRYVIRPRALHRAGADAGRRGGRGVTTLAHISDLHFGTESPEVVEGLLEDLASVEPSLVVVSGDLTQRARRKEFMAARLFLDRIPFPRLVVPGNHDIPLFDLVTRFARPLARFRRYVDADVEPLLRDGRSGGRGNEHRTVQHLEGRAHLTGTDRGPPSAGSVPSRRTLEGARDAPPVPAAPGTRRLTLVGRAAEALRAAEACGVDLVLAGHLHRGYTGDIRTHHAGIRRAMLVAQAGTAVSHRVRNEANSYNVIRLSAGTPGFLPPGMGRPGLPRDPLRQNT